LFRSRALWFGLVTVFLVHTLNALSFYQPRYFPKIPLGFDFKRILSEPPWYYLPEDIKIAKFSFIVIGATYFIRSKAAFSLWVIFLLVGLLRMQQALTFGETPGRGAQRSAPGRVRGVHHRHRVDRAASLGPRVPQRDRAGRGRGPHVRSVVLGRGDRHHRHARVVESRRRAPVDGGADRGLHPGRRTWSYRA
jgi:hypothetical protein